MNPVITPAAARDRSEVMALYRSMIGTPGCTWSADYPTEEFFDDDVARGSLFVARENGAIVACISVDHDELVDGLPCWSAAPSACGELSRLCVRADCQNRGLAKHMMRYALEILKQRGFSGARYLVSPHNPHALAAYRAMNFTEAGKASLFGQDWLCYELMFGDQQ